MSGFLDKLTHQIYDNHKDHLGDICIVLPNRRASLFIRKKLGDILDKTSFLPAFYSIEDFVIDTGKQVLADPMGIQFQMYGIHQKLEGKNARNIEEFLPYAAWMISDFNEIDMYLVDQKKIFTHLADIKEMSLWNPDGRDLNEFEKRYLAFMHSIGDYYNELRLALSQDKQAYQGMAFRQLAEEIDTAAAQMKWAKVIFAGFNALTPAEEKIIRTLLDNGKAEVYWDADKYYTEQNEQEAGEFLKGYFKNLNRGPVLWEEDNYKEKKSIEIIGVPKNAGQVKYAGEIIQQLLHDKGKLDSTALVLPDEDLLIPMLNSIPKEAGEFNVTMGLALRNTPLFSLLNNILNLNQNAIRLSGLKAGNEKKFYSRDLIRIFSHPWFIMLEPIGSSTKDISQKIRNSNRVVLTRSEVVDFLDKHHPLRHNSRLLFPEKDGPESILQVFSTLIMELRSMMIKKRKENEQSFSIELEYLFRFSTLIKRLQDLIGHHKSINRLSTFQLIFKQLASQLRIPFYGEPLQGLQVMGVLETRTLDFDTLIMLSVNEGSLPAARMPNSFIPHEIKKSYGLPTYRHGNKVFAYHFYRLLQRAQNIFLLYNTESGQLGGGERSRYITQLLHEVKKYNPGIEIRERFLLMPPPAGIRDNNISIQKDGEVIELLKKEAERGFHPSSLNIYINCGLQFYLERLLNIKETEEADETIDNRVLGIVIHESLNELLGKYTDQTLTPDIFTDLKKQIEAEVSIQFRKAMTDGDLSHGKNHLILNVANKLLKQLFDREAEWLGEGKDLQMINLEDRFSTALKMNTKSFSGEIAFRGTIDRVDKMEGTFRILDYKTGFVNDRQLKPKSWEKLMEDPEYSKAFQLGMYSWIFHKNHPEIRSLQAGIISLRKPGKGPVFLTLPDSQFIDESVLRDFESYLSSLMEEIFNPDIQFKQTEDETRCKYCSFKEICNRNNSFDNF